MHVVEYGRPPGPDDGLGFFWLIPLALKAAAVSVATKAVVGAVAKEVAKPDIKKAAVALAKAAAEKRKAAIARARVIELAKIAKSKREQQARARAEAEAEAEAKRKAVVVKSLWGAAGVVLSGAFMMLR